MNTIERAFNALCLAALLGALGVLCHGCGGQGQQVSGTTVRRVGCALAVPACAVVTRVCEVSAAAESGGD
jgi:hypothetical protein